MTRVLVLGSVSYNLMLYVDALPEPRPHNVFARDYHETLGGTAAGKALNLQKLGVEPTLYSLIGDDVQSERVQARMVQESVLFRFDLDPAGTQRHVNLMDADGQRLSIYVEGGTFEPEPNAARLEALIRQHDLVVLDIVNYCRAFIPLIQRHRRELWCDIHDYDGKNPYHRDFIKAADVIFMSSDAMPEYRPFMKDLIAAGKRLVVCTHGKDGATALTSEGTWYEQPIVDTYALRDSNGAGDAFFAGFLYGHLQGLDVQACLQRAAIAAGLCITSRELAFPDLDAARLEAEHRAHFD